MMTHRRCTLLVLLLLTGTISCKSAGSGGDVVRPRLSVAGIAAADYYPLANGWKWAYSIWKDGMTTRAVHAVLERRGDVAVVEEGGERITYAVTPEGIAEKEGDRLGDYIIKNPIRADAEWAVADGRARIVFVEGRFEDPLIGRYEGCVLIAVTRNDPKHVTQTLFAPYLGPVSMDIQAEDGEEFVTIAQAQLVGVTRPGDAPATP